MWFAYTSILNLTITINVNVIFTHTHTQILVSELFCVYEFISIVSISIKDSKFAGIC